MQFPFYCIFYAILPGSKNDMGGRGSAKNLK